ncbi:hypothetical protein Tco_1054936 [Tanacetum coccineum]|uniref:Uncharacterized protein n=1 Tax=Tanacetum coccineum TaxID=301880 RepID=A0ABQ5GZA0_9ASTR
MNLRKPILESEVSVLMVLRFPFIRIPLLVPQCDHFWTRAIHLGESQHSSEGEQAGASGSSQLLPHPSPPSTGTSGYAQQQGMETSVSAAHESSPTNYLMNEDSILKEHVQLYDDEDTGNDHLPNGDMRKGWWKPILEEEKPVNPEPSWTILSSNISYVENNLASALVLTYEPPAENSLLAKIGDMTNIMNLCMLTDQLKLANPKGDQVRINVSRPLPLGGPLGYVTVQTEFFFNKDLENLRYGNKGSKPALLISKMKGARLLTLA